MDHGRRRGVVGVIRNPETLESFRGSLPEWVIDAAGIVTTGGDYLVVVAIAVGLWLVAERDRGPWPVVAVLGAIGLTTLLKNALGLPRPPVAEIGGYGFPSGHALGATVAYGLVARHLDIGSVRLRTVLAALVVATIAASRVVIGVHYPSDVIVGVGLGLVYLAGVERLVARWSA